jgi:hypothetical protein
MTEHPPASVAERTAVVTWKQFNLVPGPALAEKRRCGIPVNGSAAMTDMAMMHAGGVPAAG